MLTDIILVLLDGNRVPMKQSMPVADTGPLMHSLDYETLRLLTLHFTSVRCPHNAQRRRECLVLGSEWLWNEILDTCQKPPQQRGHLNHKYVCISLRREIGNWKSPLENHGGVWACSSLNQGITDTAGRCQVKGFPQQRGWFLQFAAPSPDSDCINSAFFKRLLLVAVQGQTSPCVSRTD